MKQFFLGPVLQSPGSGGSISLFWAFSRANYLDKPYANGLWRKPWEEGWRPCPEDVSPMVFTSITSPDLRAGGIIIVGREHARELGLLHPWDRGPKLSLLQMYTCHSSRNSHSPHKLGPRLRLQRITTIYLSCLKSLSFSLLVYSAK